MALDPNDQYAAFEYSAIQEAHGGVKVTLPLVSQPIVFSNPTPADGITFSLLKKHAVLSKISYCDISELKTWSCSLCKTSGIELVSTFQSPDNEMQGYVGLDHNEQSIVVAFRGSSNTQNWLSNALMIKTNIKGTPSNAHVHTGFKLEWNRVGVRTVVLDLISKSMNYSNYKLTFVGHSLGGAVAMIAALDVADSLKIDYSRIRIMTQGMPRIGDNNLAIFISSLNWNFIDRVVNNRDVVAHIPPRSLKFLHYDKVHWIDSTGKLFKCNINPGLEENDCANSLYLYNPFDHILDKYFSINMMKDDSC